jgi:hypothetical protein
VAKDAKLQQLERQLSWNSPGPLGEIATTVVDTAPSATTSLWRRCGRQPSISR